jgi:hypothetical protein
MSDDVNSAFVGDNVGAGSIIVGLVIPASITYWADTTGLGAKAFSHALAFKVVSRLIRIVFPERAIGSLSVGSTPSVV